MRKIVFISFLFSAVTISAQTNSVQKKENKPAAQITSPVREVDKAHVNQELKTDEKNRTYKMVNGKKVLVDQNGVQSLVNPDHLDANPIKKEEKKLTEIK